MSYANRIINGTPAIWLQNYGWAEAKPAQDFAVGDFILHNGGTSSRIAGIEKQTPKTITFVLEYYCNRDTIRKIVGTYKKERWVAIGEQASFRY